MGELTIEQRIVEARALTEALEQQMVKALNNAAETKIITDIDLLGKAYRRYLAAKEACCSLERLAKSLLDVEVDQ